MAKGRKSLGAILLEKGYISEQQLQEALEIKKSSTQRIGEILVDLGYVTEKEVMQAYAEQLNLPFIDLSTYRIDQDATSVLPRQLSERYHAVAVERKGNKLVVATSDPTNIFALDEMQAKTGYEIEPVLAAPSDLRELIGRTTSTAPIVQKAIKDFETPLKGPRAIEAEDASFTIGAGMEEDVYSEAQLREMVEEAPVIRLCRAMIQQAIKERASDIHIEPQRRNVRIRYRVDGVLYQPMELPKFMHAAIISRIKIMSDMNIAERRLPQDGRIRLKHAGDEYDVRVSSIPTVWGEKIVMRLLPVTMGWNLNKLGMFPETQRKIEELIKQPQGMLLSTGPTGHGKTTTQFCILQELNSVDRNIITIEDPVEYQIPGVNQVHVNRKAGVTFAVAMRHFLRQDPDVILVGEIRDLETAEMAIQAALTGHLVLSTVHTNDAPSCVTRLVDMGVEPFLISDTVTGVLAQRLARRICNRCKEPYEVDRGALRRFGVDLGEDGPVTLYKGRGCELCRYTGYYDRVGIFELMVVTRELQDLISRRAPLTDIREAARAAGMKTLLEDALEKVLNGITTIEEATRVVFTVGM